MQIVESDEPVPTGHVIVSAAFETRERHDAGDGHGDAAHPELRMPPVGEAQIMTQPGKFGLGGGGLVVGRSGAEAVSDDYPGERPWAFVGGTIRRVVIDVSGAEHTDLAQEAAAAFARQ